MKRHSLCGTKLYIAMNAVFGSRISRAGWRRGESNKVNGMQISNKMGLKIKRGRAEVK